MQVEGMYAMRGTEVQVQYNGQEMNKQFKLDYLNFSFPVKFSPRIGNYYPNIFLAPYFSFLLGDEIRNTPTHFSGAGEFPELNISDKEIRKNEYGVFIGGGFDYRDNTGHLFSFDIRYSHAVWEMFSTPDSKNTDKKFSWYNRAIAATLGIGLQKL